MERQGQEGSSGSSIMLWMRFRDIGLPPDLPYQFESSLSDTGTCSTYTDVIEEHENGEETVLEDGDDRENDGTGERTTKGKSRVYVTYDGIHVPSGPQPLYPTHSYDSMYNNSFSQNDFN